MQALNPGAHAQAAEGLLSLTLRFLKSSNPSQTPCTYLHFYAIYPSSSEAFSIPEPSPLQRWGGFHRLILRLP